MFQRKLADFSHCLLICLEDGLFGYLSRLFHVSLTLSVIAYSVTHGQQARVEIAGASQPLVGSMEPD